MLKIHRVGLEEFIEFDEHQAVVYLHNTSAKLDAYIAIHRGGLLHPSFGATRLWTYATHTDAVRDVLALARCMSYKSAFSGFGYGGAKAVIIVPPVPYSRKKLLDTYAAYINRFAHHFVTGADVGISRTDVIRMARIYPQMVGVKVDPVQWTIVGLIESMLVVLGELYGNRSFHGRTFAIQGLGKTGYSLTKFLYKKAKTIYVTDVDKGRVQKAKKNFPNVIPVSSDQLYKLNVDIFSPCATSHTIIHAVASRLHCRAIVGSANNQLENDAVADTLHRQKILYAPDYVVNAGGFISVVHEYQNRQINMSKLRTEVGGISKRLHRLIVQSKVSNTPILTIANSIAIKKMKAFV